MDDIITLAQLREAPIAHTDTGDYLFLGTPKNEFYIKGTITRARAGLFFIDIEGDKFSTHKREGFSINEEVICIITPKIENNTITFIVRSIEKINN